MSLPARKFLRELLESEEGQARFKAIYDEVTTKRVQQVWATEWHIRLDEKGKEVSRSPRKVPFELEIYAVGDYIKLMTLAASYGISKPAEEKKVTVDITARRIQDADEEELKAIIEGRANAIGPGS